MTKSSPADAAGTRSGRIWASAPIMQPVMRLMVEVRALTAAGSCGLTIVPLGRRNVIGRKQPPLVGMVGGVAWGGGCSFLMIDDVALGKAQRDRPEAAAVGRDGGVGEGAHGEARRR